MLPYGSGLEECVYSFIVCYISVIGFKLFIIRIVIYVFEFIPISEDPRVFLGKFFLLVNPFYFPQTVFFFIFMDWLTTAIDHFSAKHGLCNASFWSKSIAAICGNLSSLNVSV